MKGRKFRLFIVFFLLIFLTQTASVETQAAQIKLNKTKATLYVGKTTTLKVTGTSKDVTWKSSNKKVAVVSSKGKVTAKQEGTATITARVQKKSYKCKITVKKPGFKNYFVQVNRGKSVKLKLLGDKAVKWKSSDEFVAKVDSNGKVTACGMGQVGITATSAEGNTYSCYVFIPYEQHTCKYKKATSREICGSFKVCSICGCKKGVNYEEHKYKKVKTKESENGEYGYEVYKCKKCKQKYTKHNIFIGAYMVSDSEYEDDNDGAVMLCPGEKAKIKIDIMNKKLLPYITVNLTEEGEKYLKLSKDGYITYKSNKAISQEENIDVDFEFTVIGAPDDIVIEQMCFGSVTLPGKKSMKELARYKETREKEKEIISQVIQNDMTDAEKVLAIHDWMCRNVRYDYDALKKIEQGIELTESEKECYDAAGAVLKGKAVCSGYSFAFADFMELLNIPYEIVTSETMNHAWNEVKLDGEWYWIDNTWDACVTPCHMSLSYKWFLKNGKRADDQRSESENNCTGVKLRYQVFEKYRVDSLEDIKAQLQAQINQDYMYLAVYDENVYYDTVKTAYEILYEKEESAGIYYPDIEAGPIAGTNYDFFSIVIIEKTNKVQKFIDGAWDNRFMEEEEYYYENINGNVQTITKEVPESMIPTMMPAATPEIQQMITPMRGISITSIMEER